MFTNKKFLLIAVLLIFNNSYATRYMAKPLDLLPISTEQANTVSFNYNIFNKAECKKYLGREKILKTGFQPIQICLTNNSDRHYTLSLDTFDIPCVEPEVVANHAQFNLTARVLGWTLGGLFLWPLFITAIIEGVQTPEANSDMSLDYERKALKTSQFIKPFSTVNGLIFVQKDNFNNEFSFALTDSETNERKVFSVLNKISNIKK